MRIPKKLIVISSLAGIVIMGISGIRPGAAVQGEFKNLQVLPAGISSKKLSKIMIDEFEDDLGMTCSSCHAENKVTHQPDYASDEKPEKEIARRMMRMTMGINEKYFDLKHPVIGDSVLAVTCATCHHGAPFPADAVGE